MIIISIFQKALLVPHYLVQKLIFSIKILLMVSSLFVTLLNAAEPIRVASKIDTEGGLLGNIIVLMLEKNGLPIENKLSLGVTSIVRSALLAGEIDLYPEYTGNGAFFSQTTDDPVWKSLKTGYQRIKSFDAEKHNIVWLTPSPANNTWAIAVTSQLAETNGLNTLEDFARYVNAGGTVKLAGSAEFVDSAIALPSFQQTYDFTLSEKQLLVLSGGNTSATIRAAGEGINQTNAAMVYGTDGAISVANLVVLDDTKGAQAVYAPAPVIRAQTLESYPQIEKILAPVFASLNREVLQQLNKKIQVDGMAAQQVAKDYLQQNSFLGK